MTSIYLKLLSYESVYHGSNNSEVIVNIMSNPNEIERFCFQNGLVNSPTRISSERALALGDKAYRCNYEGCGRLYTTQHHLKVSGMFG